MTNIRRNISRIPVAKWQLLLLVALVAGAIWVPFANARYRTNGAGGCGNFKAAVDLSVDGDAVTPMFNGNDTARNSEGAIITQDLIIEGGWSPPASNCNGANVDYATSADMLAAGFTYGGPNNRAELFYGSGPIITVDPAVKKLLIYGTDFLIENGNSGNGGGIVGTSLSAANIRIDQADFKPRPFSTADVGGDGGGFYLDINNASRLTISDSTLSDLTAAQGGGFELVVRGNSHVTLNNVSVVNNSADVGSGGGGRIIMHSGYVTITDSLFSNNSAVSEGGALRIERATGSTGPAEIWIINTRFTGNTAPINADISVNGAVTVHNLLRSVALPFITTNKAPGSQIQNITRTGNTYVVDFKVVGFQPSISGQHVHFFFDTVTPTQAGTPGVGPWAMYAGTSPYNLLGVANRPPGATRMCILVANANHSVNQQTGNCTKLP